MAKKSTKLQAVSGLLSENNITSDSINLSDKLIYEIKGYAENIQLDNKLNADFKVKVTVRPEEFILNNENEGIKGKIITATFLGKYMDYVVELEDGMKMELSHDLSSNDKVLDVGDTIYLKVNMNKINIYTEDGTENLLTSGV